ncbi:hypothetical protein PMPD1_0433 [Paramixta manurensis]|uniref:Phage membrane protein n=1 Tax=Paramixta manurensis TaxID=2740817 RepID=A0A6M8UF61_9GAMM|nr:hypothetical protein PMPD1_0433 [Erwiniaceae bacterium PD-1]
MDTIEELSGTYFYKGMPNLSAGELFFWIFLDKIDEQYGIHDLVAVSCIILGLPLLKTRAKPGAATKGTSIASKLSRRYLDIHLPFRLPTITNKSIKLLKPMYVNNLGAFVGRTVPVVGWLLLANDFARITFNTTTTYNRIARGDDKVW